MTATHPNFRRWLERTAAALLIFGAAGMLGGCSTYQPYEYHDDRDEMQGPGLFSGEDGVFTLYGKKSAQPPEDAADPDEGSKETEGKEAKATP